MEKDMGKEQTKKGLENVEGYNPCAQAPQTKEGPFGPSLLL